MRRTTIAISAACLVVSSIGAGVTASAHVGVRPLGDLQLRTAEARTIDILNAEEHTAHAPVASAKMRGLAREYARSFYGAKSRPEALHVLAGAPEVVQQLIAWDLTHPTVGSSPIGSGRSGTLAPAIKQYPAPDPKDVPQPADTSYPTEAAPGADVNPAPDQSCWNYDVRVVMNKNTYGISPLSYDHYVAWCEYNSADPAASDWAVRFVPKTGFGAAIYSCADSTIWTCSIADTHVIGEPGTGPDEFMQVTTSVIATSSLGFSVSAHGVSHDFAFACHTSSKFQFNGAGNEITTDMFGHYFIVSTG